MQRKDSLMRLITESRNETGSFVPENFQEKNGQEFDLSSQGGNKNFKPFLSTSDSLNTEDLIRLLDMVTTGNGVVNGSQISLNELLGLRMRALEHNMQFIDGSKEDSFGYDQALAKALPKINQLIAAASTTEAHDEEPPRADDSVTPPPAETPKAEEKGKEDKPRVEQEEKKEGEEQAEGEGEKKDQEQQDLSDDDADSENRDDSDGPHSSTTGGGTGPNPITFESLNSIEVINQIASTVVNAPDGTDLSSGVKRGNVLNKYNTKTFSSLSGKPSGFKKQSFNFPNNYIELANSIASVDSPEQSALQDLGITDTGEAWKVTYAFLGKILANCAAKGNFDNRNGTLKAFFEATLKLYNYVISKKGME